MPEILEVYQDTTLTDSSWYSRRYFFSNSTYVTFTVDIGTHGNTYKYGVYWYTTEDDAIEIYIDEYNGKGSVSGNNTESQTIPVRARYGQFYIENVSIIPTTIKTQAFFSHSSLVHLNNAGTTGGSLYIPQSRTLRNIISSNDSISIKQVENFLDLGCTGAFINISHTGAVSPIAFSTGPNLKIKGFTGSTGISISSDSNNVIITSSASISALNSNVQITGTAPNYSIGIGNCSGSNFSFNLIQSQNSSNNAVTNDPGYNLCIGSHVVYRAYNNGLFNTIYGLAACKGALPVGGYVTACGFGTAGAGVIWYVGQKTSMYGAICCYYGCGDENTVIGYNAMSNNGLTTQNSANRCLIAGNNAGQRCGDDCVILGHNSSSSATTGGGGSVYIGSQSCATPLTGNNNICIGFQNCYSGGARSNIVAIGANCATPSTDGRLAFGNSMETPVSISNSSPEQLTKLINLTWNGTDYRVPLLSSTATDIISTSAIGEIYYHNALGTSSSGINTVGGVVLAPNTSLETTANAGSNYFSMPQVGRITYLGTITQLFHCTFSLSASIGSVNQSLVFKIHKNGTLQSKSVYYFTNPASNNNFTITGQCVLSLATNDYLEIWAQNETSATEMTIRNLNLVIVGG